MSLKKDISENPSRAGGKSSPVRKGNSSKKQNKKAFPKKNVTISFNSLFLNELRNLYNAESQQLDFFSEVIEGVITQELKKTLVRHLEQTTEQLKRLDTIFQSLDQSSAGILCEPMECFAMELEEILNFIPTSEIKDSAIIAALQRIEHYEIACYGTARTFALQLKLEAPAESLNLSLQEEIDTDKKLSSVAEGGFFTTGVNKKACKLEVPLE